MKTESETSHFNPHLADSIREQIHCAMRGVGTYIESVPGESYLCHGLGLKGLLMARLSEERHYIVFGIRLIYVGGGIQLIQGILLFDDGDFWVWSDVKDNLNGRVKLTSAHHPLLENTLAYIQTLRGQGHAYIASPHKGVAFSGEISEELQGTGLYLNQTGSD